MRFVITTFCLFHCISWSNSSLTKSELILSETHDEVIVKALQFLVNRQKRDGSWIYDAQPFTGKITYKGSIVRQAGTLFGAALAYDGKNKQVQNMLKSAMDYFQIHSTPFDRRGFKLRLLSENHEGYTGTSALFLCAFFYLHHQWPEQFPVNETIYKELMDTLEYYVLPGGGITRYMNAKESYIDRLGRPAEPYASAQHFLALAFFHFVFKRKHLSPSLKDYIEFYDRRWTYSDLVPSYHWIMQAYWILSLLDNPDLEKELPDMVYNLQTAAEKEIPIHKINNNYCAQVEGYGAYLRYKWDQKELERRALYKMSDFVRHLKNFQLKETTKKRVITDGKQDQLPLRRPEYHVGGFWHKAKGKYHTRIDVTQHCLAAFVHHKALQEGIQDKAKWNRWISHSDRWRSVPIISDELPIPKLMHPVQLKTVIREVPIPINNHYKHGMIQLPGFPKN